MNNAIHRTRAITSLLKDVAWTPRPSGFSLATTDEASVLRLFQQGMPDKGCRT